MNVLSRVHLRCNSHSLPLLVSTHYFYTFSPLYSSIVSPIHLPIWYIKKEYFWEKGSFALLFTSFQVSQPLSHNLLFTSVSFFLTAHKILIPFTLPFPVYSPERWRYYVTKYRKVRRLHNMAVKIYIFTNWPLSQGLKYKLLSPRPYIRLKKNNNGQVI